METLNELKKSAAIEPASNVLSILREFKVFAERMSKGNEISIDNTELSGDESITILLVTSMFVMLFLPRLSAEATKFSAKVDEIDAMSDSVSGIPTIEDEPS